MTGEQIAVALGKPLPAPGFSPQAVLALAAAGGRSASQDPVDLAAVAAASASGCMPAERAVSVALPQAGRPYSVSCIAGPSGPESIARGDPNAIIAMCDLSNADKSEALRAAKAMIEGGARPWAIATRDSVCDVWRLAGLIPVEATANRRRDSGEYIFVPVWSLLLRSLHWLWAVLITALVVTGFEIQTMALSTGTTRIQTGFFFGYVRLAHFICGWLLAAILLLRIADALFTGRPYESWRAMIPIRSGKDARAFFEAIRNYALLRTDEGRTYLGHDPLAKASFAGCYLVMIMAVVSGFSLYGLYEPQHWFFRWFIWPARLFGAAEIRLFHVAMMWLLILFIPAHIYLVIRADGFARAGSLSAMLSGGRWIRKGSSLEDA